eukprot:PITA_36126
MEERNITTLNDISSWNQNRWIDWKDLHLPQDLKDLWLNLKSSLSGSAPTNKEKDDRYIWDTCGGSFSVKEEYKSLQNITPTANWNIHTATWKSECLPKVKHFNWTLLKGKILTAENLRKRGIQGPSICCFCRAEEESIQHSFLLCTFAQSCWNQLISPLEVRGNHDQIHNLQKNWKKDFPHSRKGKNNLTSVWKCIPATLFWNLWLARNNHVFNKKQPKIDNVIAKTIANISEARKAHQKQSNWKLRGTKEEISQWILAQNCALLFFDGASKNNPGAAGAGGIIKNHNGTSICRYEWGLGTALNNAAEVYSLLLGTTILSRWGLRNAIILGDSTIIISAMIIGKEFIKEGLNNIRTRIIDNLRNMGEVTFMHVLRENNAEADSLASKAVNRQ